MSTITVSEKEYLELKLTNNQLRQQVLELQSRWMQDEHARLLQERKELEASYGNVVSSSNGNTVSASAEASSNSAVSS